MSGIINYDYLRPLKANLVKELHSKEFVVKKQLAIKIYNDATILPLKREISADSFWGKGGVIDIEGNYVELSSIPKLINGSYNFDDYDVSDQTVVYCGYFRHHWGEFIAFCLPRLYLAVNDNDEIDSYIFFTDENTQYEISGNYKLILKNLGVLDKVKIISKPTKYRKVIIPELSYDSTKSYYSKEYLSIFDKINNNSHSGLTEKHDKIFLTRAGLKKSSNMESGTEMLDDFFSKNGFFVLSPEQISLDDMIYYIDNARTVACISGTLPHNMLFARERGKGKELVIIERNALFNLYQPETNKMINFNVTFVDGNTAIYPVELSYGPFIYTFNDYMKRYASDNGYVFPDDKFFTEKYKKMIFRDYIKRYSKEHGLCLYMPAWNKKQSDVIFEAYNDGEAFFEDYLKGKKYYKLSQYFSVNYIKRIIKKLLKRR